MRDPSTIHPREVADKSSKENLTAAIAMALAVESEALRHNSQTFNTNRYAAVGRLADYEELKDEARRIKEDALARLPELIATLTRVVTARGGKVFFAKTAVEAREYVREVCTAHRARLVVKAKSITSEEIHLNQALEEVGIEVAETDLAEFILQVSKEQPSHIVAPAIHRSRERISALFKEKFTTDLPLETGEDLTAFARGVLRQKFLSADIGISGANMLAAEEGTLLLVESEGNIRLTTHLPAVHIAVAGIEKIVPRKRDLGVFIELLASSATGQPLSTYTNVLEPPLGIPVLNLNGRSDTEREFHLVLLDNGRTAMYADEGLREALSCLRCSACMNVCTVFQAVGGHAFGGECYTGGIGGAWTVGTSGSVESGRFAELCTGCARCVPNCPVRIDIPRLNNVIKQRLLDRPGGASLQKAFFGNFSLLARVATIAPALANRVSDLPLARSALERIVGFDRRRRMPKFARRTLTAEYRAYRKQKPLQVPPKLQLFADVYTDFSSPRVGMATVRVFERLGIPLGVTRSLEDGRALQSQGMLRQAERHARKTSAYLDRLIAEGCDILVAEPSVLALLRSDYGKLLNDSALFARLHSHLFDPFEYLLLAARRGQIDPGVLRALLPATLPRVFYHGHCQLKSIGAGSVAPDLFRALGFPVESTTVECCGMAGSFGYKTAYYDISMNVGNDLMHHVPREEIAEGRTVILASGTSCREQIGGALDREVMHPIEFLDSILQPTPIQERSR